MTNVLLDALKASCMARRPRHKPLVRRAGWAPCAWCWHMTLEGVKPEPDGVGSLCVRCERLLLKCVERPASTEILRDFYQDDSLAIRRLCERFPHLAEELGLPAWGRTT
jgi:hypothetical protein